MGFEIDAVWGAMPRLMNAVGVNFRIAMISILLALLGGTLLTILRSFKIRIVNAVIAVFMSFVRGTPLLIQIFLAYYGLPALGLRLSPQAAGILALSLNSAFFVSEILRGSLPSIEDGQIEAATALGLRPRPIWSKVVLPQLFRKTLPMLINEATVVLKGTALLAVITVVETLRVAQQIGSSTFRPFEPIVGAAILFLAMNLVLVTIGWVFERRFAKERR
ncbi:MAG: amino acid ABC transporter permease [Rhodobacteraceae bacterium]|nr:amino acid ABC transporter permease [Paracoccaceae bacterium]TVR47897.1 MAG: amino acid ABC transporter permease [Paracoccaceae bacterium]